MHNISWDLLKDLRKRFEQFLGADKIARYIPQEDKLPHLVGYVFSTAAGAIDIDRTTEPDRTMIMAAAELLITMLAEGRGHSVRDAGAASLDVDESVELDYGNLNTDPWNIRSGELIDFVTKTVAGGMCPVQ